MFLSMFGTETGAGHGEHGKTFAKASCPKQNLALFFIKCGNFVEAIR